MRVPRIVWMLLAASVLCGSLPAQDAQVPAAVHEAAYYSMVRISNEAGGGGRFWGSGTHVNDGMVVTCAHLFRENGRQLVGQVNVHFIDGHQSAATLVAIDHPWDLALLQLQQPPSYQGTMLASQVPVIGEQTYHGGFGGSGAPALFHGTVHGFNSHTAGAPNDWLSTSTGVRTTAWRICTSSPGGGSGQGNTAVAPS